jgi:beta-ribofuranosylaminobenzene 5'-phosphate synthase
MFADSQHIVVEAPARIHLGFLDLGGGLGRRFGSLGLTLEELSTRVLVSFADRTQCEGPQSDRALSIVARMSKAFVVERPLRVVVERAIPQHAGLGSGTQLALAVGTAMAHLHGLRIGARQIAVTLDRGNRSGIGIGAFESGGFLLDGGRGPSGDPPPIVSRMPFPADWRVLLILDHAARGLHDAAESRAFSALPAFSEELGAHLCRLALMRALPALAESDLENFGRAVSEIQRSVGDYFAPAQGGRYSSRPVTEALAWLEAEGVRGVGQSSWGPTGFGIIGSPADGESLWRKGTARFAAVPELQFVICRGRNQGASIAAPPSIGVAANRSALVRPAT